MLCIVAFQHMTTHLLNMVRVPSFLCAVTCFGNFLKVLEIMINDSVVHDVLSVITHNVASL